MATSFSFAAPAAGGSSSSSTGGAFGSTGTGGGFSFAAPQAAASFSFAAPAAAAATAASGAGTSFSFAPPAPAAGGAGSTGGSFSFAAPAAKSTPAATPAASSGGGGSFSFAAPAAKAEPAKAAESGAAAAPPTGSFSFAAPAAATPHGLGTTRDLQTPKQAASTGAAPAFGFAPPSGQPASAAAKETPRGAIGAFMSSNPPAAPAAAATETPRTAIGAFMSTQPTATGSAFAANAAAPAAPGFGSLGTPAAPAAAAAASSAASPAKAFGAPAAIAAAPAQPQPSAGGGGGGSGEPAAARFPAIAWGPADELQVVRSAAPEAAYEDDMEEEGAAEQGRPQPPPSAPRSAAAVMGEPHLSAPYFQRLVQTSYHTYSELLLLPGGGTLGSVQAARALEGYEECLLQCIAIASSLYADAQDDDAEEVHDDLLRLSMSSAIMHLSRIFFFDEMGGADLCSALRAWFASFSAGASAGGGHLNILNPESCLDDEPLWQFLHKRSEFPAEWRSSEWSAGPSSPGWRKVYAFVTTGALHHAHALLVQMGAVSTALTELVHSWARLLDEGTAAPDFVYARGGLAEQAEALLSQSPTPAEAALLRLLTGDGSVIGQHEPVNWVEHLLCTLLYGRRGDGSCFSPIYDKELVGETLAEGSMDAVERSAESGSEVCTFMNPKLFREICLQNGRGVLQQIAEPEVALGFVWLELHLGHTLQLAGRLVDDLPIPAGPFQGASYLEWLSLDYAEQCRGVKQLQHIALRVYLSACPLYGQDFLRETLGRLGHSAMTEKEGRKLLSIARAMGEDTVGATICRTLSASADAAGQRATAVYWLLQAGETALADALAEKMLRELSEAALSPKPKEPSAAEAEEEEARDQELRNAAMIALQAAASTAGSPLKGMALDGEWMPPALGFLCGVSELRSQVAALRRRKAEAVATMADGAPLPELQEQVEQGVEVAVAQLMRLFQRGTRQLQFWPLLLDEAMALASICSPAFDRNEAIALMGFVEQYAANRAVATSLLRGTSGFGHVHGSSSEAQGLGAVRKMLADNLGACLLVFD